MTSTSIPSSRTIAFSIAYVLLSACAAYYMRYISQVDLHVDRYCEIITTTKVFPNRVPLRQSYTGIASIDYGLSFLVVAFIDGAAGWDPSFYFQQIHFLFSFFAIVAVWQIEACRAQSPAILSTFLFTWVFLYQTAGGAIIIPLYYLAYTIVTRRAGNLLLSRMDTSYAKALLPALAIGYLVPTIILFWPWKDINTVQLVIALWQPAPLFPILLLAVLPKILSSSSTKIATGDDSTAQLRRLYAFTGLVTACVHIGVLYAVYTSSNPEVSFERVFIPDIVRGRIDPSKGLAFIFQIDFWIIFGASLLWAWQAVFDLRLIGVTNASPLQAAILILITSVVLGPGAAICGVWYWREGVLALRSAKGYKKQ